MNRRATGTRWTPLHSRVHLGAQTLWWRLVQDVQFTVVTNLEHLRRRLHADAVEIAQAQIYNDFMMSLRALRALNRVRALMPRVYDTTAVSE